MARNYSALPHEYLEEMSELNDAEFGRLTRALLAYSMTGEPIALCGNERFYAKRVMAQEDRFRENYEAQSTARSEAGKAGATARWQDGNAIPANGKNGKRINRISKDGNAIPANGKNGNTETNTDTETNTQPPNGGMCKKTRVSRVAPPTLDEVMSYAEGRGRTDLARQFYEYFEAGGWVDAKGQPVRSWKQKFLTWEKYESPKRSAPKAGTQPGPGTCQPSDAAIKASTDWLDEFLSGGGKGENA